MSLKQGEVMCPFCSGAGSPSSTMWPGPMPTSIPSSILIHPAIWPQQIWAETWGGCAPLDEGQVGPHLTQCTRAEAYLHAKFHLDPSNHLATVHQRHRRDRQRSDSIWQTILQTVTQKWPLNGVYIAIKQLNSW